MYITQVNIDHHTSSSKKVYFWSRCIIYHIVFFIDSVLIEDKRLPPLVTLTTEVYSISHPHCVGSTTISSFIKMFEVGGQFSIDLDILVNRYWRHLFTFAYFVYECFSGVGKNLQSFPCTFFAFSCKLGSCIWPSECMKER